LGQSNKSWGNFKSWSLWREVNRRLKSKMAPELLRSFANATLSIFVKRVDHSKRGFSIAQKIWIEKAREKINSLKSIDRTSMTPSDICFSIRGTFEPANVRGWSRADSFAIFTRWNVHASWFAGDSFAEWIEYRETAWKVQWHSLRMDFVNHLRGFLGAQLFGAGMDIDACHSSASLTFFPQR